MNNTHIKNIWLNTGIEVSEADVLIFVGYSLRPEDFYFRYLLSKNIKQNVKVYIFDYTPSAVPAEIAQYKAEIQRRYSSFLQKASIEEIHVDGWEPHVDDIKSLIA